MHLYALVCFLNFCWILFEFYGIFFILVIYLLHTYIVLSCFQYLEISRTNQILEDQISRLYQELDEKVRPPTYNNINM